MGVDTGAGVGTTLNTLPPTTSEFTGGFIMSDVELLVLIDLFVRLHDQKTIFPHLSV